MIPPSVMRMQKVALAHPARLAAETVHPRFGALHSKIGITVRLTINNGYE